MTTFSFNVKAKPSNKKKNINNIIDKNIKGIIFINEDNKYYVVNEYNTDIKYDIDEQSYNSSNVRNVYRLINGQRYLYIRNVDNYFSNCYPLWLPFAPGNCVEGDIIIKNMKHYFHIKKVYNDYNNHLAIKALHWYKEHWKEIK